SVQCVDNPVLAWLVDETGAEPPAPSIVGTLPPAAPNTSPVVSPAWTVREGQTFFIPDIARGSLSDMLTFVATNNGAQRKAYCNLADPALVAEGRQWAEAHPQLALSAPPTP